MSRTCRHVRIATSKSGLSNLVSVIHLKSLLEILMKRGFIFLDSRNTFRHIRQDRLLKNLLLRAAPSKAIDELDPKLSY